MKVISRQVVDDFIKKHADSKSSLESWYCEAEKAEWVTSVDIRNRYASASFLSHNYVIFNIKGNSYRLVTKIAYNTGVVLIKWIGTHSEYDKKTFP
jgi:mRNA interferase HigB